MFLAPVPAPGSAAASASADFYVPPSPLPAGEHGTLVRHQPSVVPATLLASARRIMYLSEDARGSAIAVTGTVIVPLAPWLGGGQRPVIGFAPGTQGLGDACAPSKLLQSGLEYEEVMIATLVTAGYAVVVTDYEGLGTPGVHTYMNRASQAHALLDGVRAAQDLPAVPDAGPVGLYGYSQGGGAAAAAAEVEAAYTTELDVRGAAIGAPPADLADVGRSLDGSMAAAFLGYAVVGLEAAYPDQVNLDDYLNERGEELADAVVDECVWESLPRYAFTRSSTLTEDGRPVADYLVEEPFVSLVADQRIGSRPPQVPTFVAHSLLDDIVPYPQGRQMAREWCAGGAQVRFETIGAPTHVLAMPEFGTRAVPWLARALNGRPGAANCGLF
ncbi:lipase [Nocardioides antri]|uniref:Lipase n=2 Tax=Nocardioides antri TaxID=2607659 RepID=A0A5B1MA30_9ACTN|nr:lipase [Nocardioides antri]